MIEIKLQFSRAVDHFEYQELVLFQRVDLHKKLINLYVKIGTHLKQGFNIEDLLGFNT